MHIRKPLRSDGNFGRMYLLYCRQTFKDSDSLPIGKACENMRIIILNEKNEIAKTNEQGEICVIGTGVSLGYWNNPEITQKAFIQNPVNP